MSIRATRLRRRLRGYGQRHRRLLDPRVTTVAPAGTLSTSVVKEGTEKQEPRAESRLGSQSQALVLYPRHRDAVLLGAATNRDDAEGN